VLYNVILIAGISTVVFNVNPLLRYDGYYILADLIQIPNLRSRANQYLTYVMERRLFGLKLPDFEATTGERQWFVFFAIASFCYRMFVVFAIALFIATQYFIVGIVLALWAILTSVFYPIFKGVGYLLLHPKLRRHRVRALSISGAIVVGLVVALCFAPVPLWSRAEGVISVPDDAQVRAGADGFLRTIVVKPGQPVLKGSPLIVAEDPTLEPHIRVLEAQLRLLQTRAQSELFTDKVRWEVTREEIQSAQAELDHAQTQARDLTIVSPTSGIFVLLMPPDDLPDRYVRKGQPLGYVVPSAMVRARVLVSQDEVDMVRSRTEGVEVKLAGRAYDTYRASIRREIPAASNKFSNLAMSSVGGGRVPVDPTDTKEPKALNSWFEFEIEMPATNVFVLGEHVYVRFEHGAEPVAWRVYRSVRQLFMRQFTV
jgi:putative peptide zinc metalloprotease protein